MNRIIYRSLFLLIAIGMCGSAAGDGDSNPLLIEKALDEPANIRLQQITLEDLFGRLSQKIGVAFDLEQAGPALDQLPYGRLTQIESAQIQGLSWRNALTELLKPFSLTFQAGNDRIYILGTDILMRQPQRLSIAELEAIVRLQTTVLDEKSDNLLQQIRTQTQIPFDLYVHGKKLDRIEREEARNILGQGALMAATALDRYGHRVFRRGQPSVWYIQSQGESAPLAIHVVDMGKLVNMKLDQRIDISFKSLPIQTILHQLAQRAVLDIRFEPGCIGLVDVNLRENCTLVMHSGTIKTALETLSGMTGLEYSYNSQGLLIKAGENLIAMAHSGTTSPSESDPLMCIITMDVPGADYESRILIRQSDLRKEGLLEKFQEVQQQNIQKFMQNLREIPIK